MSDKLIGDLKLIQLRVDRVLKSKSSPEEIRKELALLYHLFLEHYCQVDHLHFSTLFTRISFLKNLIPIKSRQLFALQTFRRAIESASADLTDEQVVEMGKYAFGILFHYILSMPFPKEPDSLRIQKSEKLEFKAWSFGLIFEKDGAYYFTPEDEIETDWKLELKTELQGLQISRLLQFQKYFIHANLIAVKFNQENKTLKFQVMVLLPNYLIDVTSVAESFKPSGKLPQAYLVKKFSAPQKKLPLLMGNAANHMLDTLIYEPDVPFKQLMSEVFHQSPLAYISYDDDQVRSFMDDARKHYKNISQVLKQQLASFGIDIKSTYTEPSFLSNTYGIQGRLDVLHQSKDNRRNNIIELKSGSAYKPNAYGIAVNHYTQTLLYDLMINSSIGQKAQVSNYILYSKLDKNPLRFAPKATALQHDALSLRNDLVYIDLVLQNLDRGDVYAIFKNILNAQSAAMDRFIQEDLVKLIRALDGLSTLETDYFKSYIAFVAREHYLAKLGEHGIEKSNGLAGLWLDSLEEKMEQFRVLAFLEIEENNTSDKNPILILKRSEKSNKLSRFRKGDIVILYPYSDDNKSPLQNQVFKSTIIALEDDKITLRLRNPQFNQTIFESFRYWNLEGDVLDGGFLQLYRNLVHWTMLDKGLRDLYLSLRKPNASASRITSNGFQGVTNEQENILTDMIAADEYYLLWGPPGTGKTSVIIRELIRHYNSKHKPILLLAYTNRAVDEICEAIISVSVDNPIPFIRVGSKYACDPKFKDNLLSVVAAQCQRRDELRNLVQDTGVFVSTISSINSKSELFDLKKFEAIIIDEASQLLEPTVLGILGKSNKLIMIGDHKQLPAVVQQSSSSAICKSELLKEEIDLNTLDKSMFERLIEKCKANNWTNNYGGLTNQGRMHKQIVRFPSLQFYENKLEALLGIERLHTVFDEGKSFYHFILSKRVVFIDVPMDENLTHKTNHSEAKIVMDLLGLFKAELGSELSKELGVITPYRAQIALIDYLYEKQIGTGNKITIDTVERYQGSARNHIIYSMCSNKSNDFIKGKSSDDVAKKFNVAITRSKESLIILGNKKLLSKNPMYHSWIEQAYLLKLEELEQYFPALQ